MEGRRMNNTHNKNWPSTPREHAIKPATDWRDTAIACIEWLASGFIGVLFGSFAHMYWDLPMWATGVSIVLIAGGAHTVLATIAKQFKQ
jgi:fatty acid desaturase